MKTIQTRHRVLITLAVVAVLAAPLPAGAATTDDFIVAGPAAGPVRQLEPLAIVELGNGDDIAFSALLDEHRRINGVAVTGVRSPDRGATTDVPGLAGANPLELFVALARPGAQVPPELHQLYGAQSHLGRQGWARSLVLQTGPSSLTCPATYWQQQLGLYAAAFGDDPFSSTWDGPATMPQHWGPSAGAPADGHQYRDLIGQVDDVTAFYGSVLYCVEDLDNATTNNGMYVGNYVSSWYRAAGTGTWNLSGQAQLVDVGDVYEHVYSPDAPFSPAAAAFDFRITIRQAKLGDQFHVGATWVKGRPSDIKAAG